MEKIFNNDRLRGRIYEKYRSIANFASEIGMTKTRVTQKLNNKTKMTREDIAIYIDKLEIKQEEIYDYFFN